MTKFHRTVRISHTPENLYELVSDIDSYPSFIKWIRRMDVTQLPSSAPGTISRIGTAKVGFSGFSETMATRVDCHADQKLINVSLVRGPLKHLNNRWGFKPVGEGATDVDFLVDFEFRNFLLRTLAAANFELAVSRIMSAFVAEADRRYGPKA